MTVLIRRQTRRAPPGCAAFCISRFSEVYTRRPFFMHLFSAVLLFQVLTNLFHEIRSHAVRLALHIQTERRILGALGFLSRDLAVFQHVVDHQVAATQCALGIVDRRIRVRRFGQARKHRGFLQRQVLGLLAEVVSSRPPQIRKRRARDKSGWRTG